MFNQNLARQAGPFDSATHTISNNRTSSFTGVNLDRQSRFQARSARRWGDWSVLEIATPVLWLDDGCGISPYGDYALDAPALIELWP